MERELKIICYFLFRIYVAISKENYYSFSRMYKEAEKFANEN